MSKIKIYLSDGTVQDFEETSASGGSYCTTLKLENGFAIIEDAYGKQTIIPESRIDRIEKESNRRGW